MTPLNNQELRKKIIETLHPERNGLLIKGGIAEGANHEGLIVDGLEKLIESELANRERVARIDELRKIRIKQFDSSQGDYELGWNELRHELRCHIKDRLAQLKNNTTKQEDIKDE